MNTNDPKAQPIPATNPSPFKLFKEHTVPTPTNKFQNPASSASFNTSGTSSNLGSAGIPNSFPAFTSSNAVFTQNPIHPQPADLKTSAMSELEIKKYSILYQKRVQDVLDGWKNTLDKEIVSFIKYSEELMHKEQVVWEIQNKLLLIHNSYMRIKKEKQYLDENLDIMENELSESNSAVTFIEKEIENVFLNNGIYVMNQDTENIYSATSSLSKVIDEVEKELFFKIKEANDRLEDEEPEDLEQITSNFIDSIRWLEQISEETASRMEKIKKNYEHLI